MSSSKYVFVRECAEIGGFFTISVHESLEQALALEVDDSVYYATIKKCELGKEISGENDDNVVAVYAQNTGWMKEYKNEQ